MARNSILQSGWEHPFKAHFLGENYTEEGVKGNDIKQTNVPNNRVHFRLECLEHERNVVHNGDENKKSDSSSSVTATMKSEASHALSTAPAAEATAPPRKKT